VRSEQNKYEAFSRQRNSVMTKYRRVFQSFNDLIAGLMRAQGFYSEMKDTVSSLQKNVETFVNNRRSEGGQLLSKIEQSKTQGADQEQQRLKELMERMSMEPSGSPVSLGSGGRKKSIPAPLSSSTLQQAGYPTTSQGHPAYNPAASPPVTPRYTATANTGQQQYMSPSQHQSFQSSNGYQQQPPRRDSYQTQYAQQPQQNTYNPNAYNPVSPPAHQQFFSPPPNQHQQHQPWGQPPPQPGAQNFLPQGYVPPPPPPGPPPNQQDYGYGQYGGQGQQGHAYRGSQGHNQQQQGDPWAGLSGWK